MDRLPEHVFIKPTPYQTVMDLWHRYYRLDDKPHTTGDDDLYNIRELMKVGEAVTTMLGDLPRPLWWAVWKSRGICTCWNFPQVNLPDAIVQAEEILTAKMRQHVVTAKYFI